jgi:hypothetical protein
MSKTNNHTQHESLKVFLSLIAAAVASTMTFCIFIAVGDGILGLGVLLYAFPVAFAHAPFALPLYHIAKRKNLMTWWFSLIGGFAVGIFPYSFFVVPSGLLFISPYFLYWIGCGLLGMVGGFAAWLTWRYLNTER